MSDNFDLKRKLDNEAPRRRGKKKRKPLKKNKVNTHINLQASDDADEVQVSSFNPEILVEQIKNRICDATVGGGSLSDWLNPTHPTYWKELKDNWKRIPKKTRSLIVSDNINLVRNQNSEVSHPFDTHCETAPEAYDDIKCVLEYIAGKIGKEPADLSIYDPFYCNGAVISNLGQLGFKNVYNKCEDFYKMKDYPEHDVLLTNPPYSGDHLQKLFDFAKTNKKPCLFLMPNYVYGKSYYNDSYKFVIPKRRYHYWTPKGLRPKDKTQSHVGTLGIRTSPFISFWYINASPLLSDSELSNLYKSHKNAYYVKSQDDIPRNVAVKVVK